MTSLTKILLVEDEASIRRLCLRMLKGTGMDLLEAENGTQAMQLLDQHGDIATVILDMQLPGMHGHEVAKQIRRRFAKMPIVFFTGSTLEESGGEGERTELTFRLGKPFTRESLNRVLSQALGLRDSVNAATAV